VIRRSRKWYPQLTLLAALSLGAASPVAAQSFSDFVASAAGCALIGESRASMPVEPLYRKSGGECVPENPRGSSISESLSWFSDSSCKVRVPFVPTPLAAFCAQIADGTVLGTADNIVPNAWTLTPGTRIDVGALSLEGVPQPYLQRIKYASFPTDFGQCELEMRVYSPQPGATGLRSMVALHGGAWRFRGFGYFGLEMTVPHLVEAGFVVYAPFYRLLDDVDGSAECQNADIMELVGDAETALNWVEANASRYGSSGKPVVFGQSAGAHLAGSLWLNRRDDISGAVLLYPPTDFTDFAQRVQSGEYTNEEGIDILRLVLGSDAANPDLSAPPIPANSYPQRVAVEPDGLAPIMMLHGVSDSLVEPRQSVRLCQALASEPILGEFEGSGELRDVVSCDAEGSNPTVPSTLHLFKEGKHAMDLCIDGGLLASKTCPAGSTASARAIGESIAEAADFARRAFDAIPGQAPTEGFDDDNTALASSSSGGSSSLLTLLLLGIATLLRRR